MTLLDQRDAQKALECFKVALSARPGDPLVLSARALAEEELGLDDLALRDAQTALTRATGLASADVVAARYLAVSGDWDKAVPAYRQLNLSAPGRTEYALSYVQALLRSGRAREAIKQAEALLAQPLMAGVRAQLAVAKAEAQNQIQDFRGQAESAQQAADLAAAAGEALVGARSLSLLGSALGVLSDQPRALEALDTAAATYALVGDQRRLAALLIESARVLYLSGRYGDAKPKVEEAIEHFQATNDTRGQCEALVFLANLRGATGDRAGAASKAKVINSILCQHGDRASQHGDRVSTVRAAVSLGYQLEGSGRRKDAERQFERALGLLQDLHRLGDESEVLGELGSLALTRLDLRMAESDFGRALQLATETRIPMLLARSLENEGDLAYVRGDLPMARRHLVDSLTHARSVRYSEGVASIQLTLAMIELDDGHPSAAATYAQNAIEILPNSGEAQSIGHADRARAFDALEQPANAAHELEQALRYGKNSQAPEVVAAVALARAKIIARSDPAEALHILSVAVEQADAADFAFYVLYLRLAMGEVEMRHPRGAASLARGHLVELEKGARQRGCRWIADRAARLASGGGLSGQVPASAHPFAGAASWVRGGAVLPPSQDRTASYARSPQLSF
jgi:tetratricopeptide (TPR) repeat protein